MPELYRLTDKADNELSTVNYQLSIGDKISDIVRSLAKRIFCGEKITFDPELLTATADGYLSAVKKGYKKDLSEVDYDSPDFETLKKITENVFQFSASKDFHILTDMTNALKDGSGKLRSFDDFQAEVDKMNVKYNGNWLRTEYNQAVAASQCAARWTEQVSRAKSMPFLQYHAVMDSNTRAEHAALHGVIKRVDSDFWDKYYPPNGWGCRCEVIQLPGKNYKETPDLDIKFTKVDSMFQVNVGKKGVVFPKGHPYFMSQCATNGCPLKGRKLADGTLKEQCKGCLQGMGECEKYVDRCREEWKKIKGNEESKSNNKNREARNKLKTWFDETAQEVRLSKKINAKRIVIDYHNTQFLINNNTLREIGDKGKYADDYPDRMELVTKLPQYFSTLKEQKPEQGIDHPDALFRVFTGKIDNTNIKVKVKQERGMSIVWSIEIV